MMKLPHSLIPVYTEEWESWHVGSDQGCSVCELSLSRYPVEPSSFYNQYFQANRIPTDIMKGKRGCSNFTECEQRAKFVQVLRATGFR